VTLALASDDSCYEARVTRTTTTDVVIIGGGLVGSLCALRLAEAGARVIVLEKSVPGAEASSAAAGILAAQSESRESGLLFDLAIESRTLYARLDEELRDRVGADIGYVRCGVMESAANDDGIAALESAFGWQRARGHRVERLSRDEVHAREPALGASIAGGLFFADDAQVDPPRLVRAVAQAAERAGATFRSGAYVKRVRVESHSARGVELDDGAFVAGHVVVAAGAWSALVDGARVPAGAVMPARGQIVELLTRVPPVGAVIYGEGGYVVPRRDGRVICGSTLEFVGYRKEVTVEGVMKILTMASTLVPALAHATLSRTWSNFRPFTHDGAPLVGESGIDGLTIATGHHRSGILMAPITAEIVRDRVLSRASRWDLRAIAPTRVSSGEGAST
jgi:glycine oxidase